MQERASHRRGLPARSEAADSAVLFPTIRDLQARDQPQRNDPRQVTGYEILAEIGRGGMGVVYKARQVQLNRLVALKMLRSEMASREQMLRFRLEAEAVARLAHPGIVQIHEIGEHQQQPFLSLEYVSGGSLDDHLGGKPLPARQAARLVQQLADAMQFAHYHGIVHRDLKPANILLKKSATEDTENTERKKNLGPPGSVPSGSSVANFVPKITDFGLAKRLDGSPGQTQAGEVIGTPSYMAPEQAEGRNEDIGPAADIYALGAILYECLTGRPPFLAGSLHETLDQVRRCEPVPPRTLTPGLPRDLETICLKCLQKAPRQRYHTAADLAVDLGRFLADEPIVARPASVFERGVKWVRRHPVVAVVAVALFLLLAMVPLYVHQLETRVKEMTAERLLSDGERKLEAGKAALKSEDSEDLQRAIILFETVRDGIGDAQAEADERLERLRQEAVAFLEQAHQAEARQLGYRPARARARKFLALRDEAFFQLYHDLLGGPGATTPHGCIEVCERALKFFPDLECLPGGDHANLLAARTEVLLLLAEAHTRLDGRTDSVRRALGLVTKAAKMKGASHGVRLRRARYLDLLGDAAGAARERQEARQSRPATSLDWFLTGQERWLAGDIRGAIQDFDRALTRDARMYWPRLLRAIGYHQLRQDERAKQELDECIRTRPDFARAYLLRAVVHVRTGELEAARGDLEEAGALELDPRSEYVLCACRGVLALAQSEFDESITAFENAVRLAPRYFQGHVNLANACWKHGQRDRAVACFDEAIRLAPRQASLYRMRSLLQSQRGQLVEALADLDQAGTLDAGKRSASEQAADLAERARLLYLAKRYREALPICKQALASKPNEPAPLRLHAELLLELGQYHEAIRAFENFLKHGKADVEVYRRRARARLCLNDVPGVIEDYTLSLALKREPGLLTARGWAYLVSDCAKPALRDFSDALALAPRDADALVGRATVYVNANEFRLAQADLDRALATRPTSSRVLYNAARGLSRLGTGSSRQAIDLRRRSAGVLHQAVLAQPETDRPRFWREQVRRDAAFAPLAGLAEFDALERQYRDK